VATVCVDRHKVLQILINLLRNAKYARMSKTRLANGWWYELKERERAGEGNHRGQRRWALRRKT